MKKLLILSALAVAFSTATAADTSGVYGYINGSPTSTTTLQDGKLYAIYDAHAQQDRSAYRYVTDDNKVYGNHNGGSHEKYGFSSNYVWKAIADGDNWKFLSISKDAYLPVADGDKNTIILTEEANAGLFTIIAQGDGHVKVKNSDEDSNTYWDGDAGADCTMSYWTEANGGHLYNFFEVSELPSLQNESLVRLKAIVPVGTDAKTYTGCYVSMDVADRSNGEGKNAYLNEEGTVLYITQDPESPQKWMFQEESVLGNTIAASGWNATATTKGTFYWTLCNAEGEFDTENPVIRLYQKSTGNIGYFGNQSNEIIYANNSVAQVNSFANYFEVEPIPSVKATLTFKRSSNDDNPIVSNFVIENGGSFPDIPGFTVDNNQAVTNTNTTATYVMNEGTPMQIYNERADSYVYVLENGLWQTKDSEEESTNFIKVKADEEGGFIIYSPSADKVVGNLVGSGSVTPVGDFIYAQKYYTGKFDGNTVDNIYYPIYADWIGTIKAGVNDNSYSFFNDNANNQANHPENIRYVCAYKRVDDGSKWIIVTNKENFKENWKMRQDLLDARGDYEMACTRLGETPDEELLEFANNFRFKGNVNLPVDDDTKTNLQTLIDKVAEAEEQYPSIIMESTTLYTIVSTSGRGALIYDREHDCMSTNYDTTTNTASDPDTSNNDHLWGFVKVDGKFYLYNRGAEKFANAYMFNVGGPSGTVYAWTVGDVPCAIELSNEAFGRAEALNNNKFVIKGGKAGTEDPAGMMIINANQTRIPCALGHNSITDGTGFILTAARATDMDETMKQKVTDGFATVNEKIETICMPLEGEEYEAETHGKQVGHFTQEAVEALKAAKEDAQALTDKEAAMYAALEAARNFKTNDANYRVVENGNVYTISDSEGNIHFTDGTSHLTAEALPEGADSKLVNWVATVADGKVSFSHTHEGAEEVAPASMYYANAQVVNFAVGDATEFTVKRSTPGKVTLNDDASKTYVITHVSADAKDAQTTHIAEIGANAANDTVYDLQGRRLAAPTKGFNIINGRKVIVK